ncbi:MULTISPECIES: chemotaxis protein CheW [unclassified Paenibacillus]|nr:MULTISPECIES: chemotaxis protein CheW [unclassified Paenibacillus]MDF9839508.1 purine-binding chemotaxis protein CheW [Paenibacillus sp. PastF-2]MDF9846089.1 purine-binding chemotaxis protein CheW [Paenibacillus sp. PastM-2]MDF9852662.1 purine-binding chemotaxis protein CheW [Paenibacillus sp. PastF-1]MDH6477607.1 purine-binding chemotaxis protein CheW [Paenibacillus sp. PastH-2]
MKSVLHLLTALRAVSQETGKARVVMEQTDQQFIVIELGGEEYALPISGIYEIIKMQKITEVPNSRFFMEGVTNLRGKIVPIISLRRRFGMEEAAAGRSTRIVVVNHDDEIVGMVVDCVQQVIQLDSIEEPGESAAGIDSRYFSGIGYFGEAFVTLLNIGSILR